MKKSDVLEYFGNVAKTARALKISVQAVYKWSEDIPDTMAFKIQVVSKGALKAEDKNDK